ncbi:retinol dehydrogenase 7 [Cylas formicarius]|uniref:retinol dehydrogenase 7 n=1 Tax=Cylas formicarius TaxID=197179 RepID=UPI002958AE28|nr:retinol dehydrogenase 7 [Cylas formicarius]
MAVLSKSLRISFEIVNELYTAVGSGVLGILILIQHGFRTCEPLKTLSVVGLTAASLIFVFSRDREKLEPNKQKVIFITGCDSGIGFSIAQHASECGFTVIAGFLSLESKGSKEIRKLYGGDIIQIQLDITDRSSIYSAVQTLEHYFNKYRNSGLHAIVNNAGVMVFGEFEWQTERLIEEQVNVNLLGTFKTTKAFCPLLRKHKARLIIVSSHCALANLPGLAVYGATKAALSSWSDGLRVELEKYGIKVLTFIPGSFASQSNLMSRQLEHIQEMHDAFTPEQHIFYSDYFKRYNMYLSCIASPTDPKKIEDNKLYKVFENSLLDLHPKAVYKNEPLRYKIYHFLFKYSPTFIRDYFVIKFMTMPKYYPPSTNVDDYDLIDDI